MGRSRPALSLRPRFKGVPRCWLSTPIPRKVITSPTNPSLSFVIAKTPLKAEIVTAISDTDNWTTQTVVRTAKSLVPDSTRLFAVNVSASCELVSERDWDEAGIPMHRIPVTEYNESAADAFCEVVAAAGDGPALFIVYSGRGTNRPAFCIASYLAKKGGMNVGDALRLCVTGFEGSITKEAPLKALTDIFGDVSGFELCKPPWYDIITEAFPVGEVPLDLVQRVRGLEKVSKKVQGAKKPMPEGPERTEVMELLETATKPFAGEDGPQFRVDVFEERMIEEMRGSKTFCTFEPRGYRGFVVARKSDEVYFVCENGEVWLLKARCDSKLPAVAMAICSIQRKRCVMFLTDMLLLGKHVLSQYPLSLRLSYLSHRFAKEIKPVDVDEKELAFMFRPVCELKYVPNLKKDLDLLVAKCDGLGFYSDSGLPGYLTLLPVKPSVQIEVSLNGNRKAVLLAESEGKESVPIGVWAYKDPKMGGLDLRTSRFVYKIETKDWQPEEIGLCDPPDSIEYIQGIKYFMDKHGVAGASRSIDSLLQEISSIEYKSPE